MPPKYRELTTLFRCDHAEAVKKLAAMNATRIESFQRTVLGLCEDRNDTYRLVFFNDDFFVSRGLKKDGNVYRYNRHRVNSSIHPILEAFVHESPYTTSVESVRYSWQDSHITLHTVKDLGEFVFFDALSMEANESLRALFDVHEKDIVEEDFYTLHAAFVASSDNRI